MRNAVPSEAIFGGEFRSRNVETLDLLQLQFLKTLEDARKRYRDAAILEDVEVMFHMYNLDPNDPIVRLALGVMEGMNLTPNIQPSGGGTDANAMRLHGIECVVVGMSTNQMHTVNEYVVIPDLVTTARFCQSVITANF